MYEAQKVKKQFQENYIQGWSYLDQFDRFKSKGACAFRDGDNFRIRFEDNSILISDSYSSCISAYLLLE